MPLVGGAGAQSRQVDAAADAGRMAYLRVVAPHAHGKVRVLVRSSDRVGVFRRRGARPRRGR